jgi:hypothetical protein
MGFPTEMAAFHRHRELREPGYVVILKKSRNGAWNQAVRDLHRGVALCYS